nr:hypothetical protein [Shimwellia pseudoproteus]
MWINWCKILFIVSDQNWKTRSVKNWLPGNGIKK